MRTIQFVYKDTESFRKQLLDIREECLKMAHVNVSFYIAWIPALSDKLKNATDCIEEIFPDAIYYGNEASGSIQNGRLTYDIAVTCNVFEDEDTTTKLLWFEEGTDFWTLDDLWKFCKAEKNLRAVEMLPSIAYSVMFDLDNNVPEIDEDILIFGGASVNYPNESENANVIAKGHNMSVVGMAVVLYYGKNLHACANYVIGWKGLGRQMEITKSSGNVISEIDGMPTKRIFEKYLGIEQEDKSNLIFPLIVEEDGVEFIRSSQTFLPDDSMQMFAKIPEKSMVRISYGDKKTILGSLLEKSTEIAAFKPQVIKAFSCTARRIFWGDEDIQKETVPLQEIAPVGGFYTGGEILRFGKRLRVLNQTLVVIGLREGDGSNQEVRKVTALKKNDKSLISQITYFLQVVAKEQKEALDIAEEEKKRNDILHDIIHSGKWAFKISNDDKIITTELSDEVKQIVNNDIDNSLMGWIGIIHPEDLEDAKKAFFATIRDHSGNTPFDITYRMVDRNGNYHWFHSAGRIIRDENGEGDFFGIHIDITDQIEEQVKSQQQLQEALTMADSANHAKTEFLFNMSHDIRTPMNAILGFTNMAIKHIDDKAKILDCLEKIQNSGDLLLSLINNVLEVSRIEAGKAVTELKAGDIYRSFANIESTMQIMAQTKDINLTFEFGKIKNRYILCDFSRCARIFVNIISNAVKYTREGGYVKVKCEEITGTDPEYGMYKYTFEDNGYGMSEEFQKHVFEQFSRENTATMTGIQGTGLGMAVCKSFVDMMNGTIECKSKLGEGTTFFVTLPFKLRDPEDGEEQSDGSGPDTAKKPEKAEFIDFRNKKVLLAEDNELNREIAADILIDKGMVVDEAEDGSVAVQKIKEKGPDYYDFVLMDIQMPVMNGYEAAKAIREMYPDAKLPIIALSANAFAEDKEASLNAGMNAHVAKPIKLDELFATLAEV